MTQHKRFPGVKNQSTFHLMTKIGTTIYIVKQDSGENSTPQKAVTHPLKAENYLTLGAIDMWNPTAAPPKISTDVP